MSNSTPFKTKSFFFAEDFPDLRVRMPGSCPEVIRRDIPATAQGPGSHILLIATPAGFVLRRTCTRTRLGPL
jgi:hypothetical protein